MFAGGNTSQRGRLVDGQNALTIAIATDLLTVAVPSLAG